MTDTGRSTFTYKEFVDFDFILLRDTLLATVINLDVYFFVPQLAPPSSPIPKA